jgi:hypothetical protein
LPSSISISTNQSIYQNGDAFILSLLVTGGSNVLNGNMGIALSLGDAFYCWPEFCDLRLNACDCFTEIAVYPGGAIDMTLLNFTWPDTHATPGIAQFYAVILDSSMSQLLLLDDQIFGWN